MSIPENQVARRFASRQRHNVEFVQGLVRRRPDLDLSALSAEAAAATPERQLIMTTKALEAATTIAPATVERSLVLETIVKKERPVLFVESDWLNFENVTEIGEEAASLIRQINEKRALFQPLLPLVGRIDVTHFPGADFLGTGWLIAPDVVVTNRHVASLIARWDGRQFAFRRGVGGDAMAATLDTLHEYDDVAFDETRRFAITEVLYIEPENGPNDIAFLRISRRASGTAPTHIQIAPVDLAPDSSVLVVGYPARASKRAIPDQEEMEQLFRGRYDVKRAAPGYTMLTQQGSGRHDCTTLGGNSGSVVFDLSTGQAAGLHFAGLYQEANYAVPASVLNDYIARKRWTRPPGVETGAFAAPAQTAVVGAAGTSTTITLPLSITIGLGEASVVIGSTSSGPGPGLGAPASTFSISSAAAEEAAKSFWDQRPAGVVAVRLGYPAEGDRFGATAFIAASVAVEHLATVSTSGPQVFQGLAVRYLPANAAELVESLGLLEAPATIAYDDAARTGADFSFEPVDEEMTVEAHVGPEYSWEVLQRFLQGAEGELVSAMYEFHAAHIADEIEDRLAEGVQLELVLDNATFSGEVEPGDFDRQERFRRWSDNFTFTRIVAPEGAAGLISNAYHIKVTVRNDGVFWLSSGNWKAGSSQPIVTQAQREKAEFADIPGNREWHVVVGNKTLADRLRHHIQQDFRRSADLGGRPAPRHDEASDLFLDIPVAPSLELERPPPGRVITPQIFTGPRRVQPLLTPDKEGAVYSEAVLELIRSARRSLHFQIPYIAIPSNPRADRGYIDTLLKALVQKLTTLDDARLILRSGGSKYSSPQHAAWYLKSKGVDIASRVRVIDNHHTKGMIVDGRRVLIGSHNWSAPGVTLNRDASLLFDDTEIADYFDEAFEIDWNRARPVNPKQFTAAPQGARTGANFESVDDAPAPGFRRVRLSDWLKEED